MKSQNSTPERPLTQRQLVKIWAAAREIGLTDERVRELLEQVVGKRSTRALTMDEAGLFIDYLVDGLGASGQGRNFVPSRRPVQQAEGPAPGRRPAGDNIIRMATHEQLAKISYLLRDLELSWDSSKFLTIVSRATGKSRIRTTLDGSRVIDALVAICARRQQEAGGDPAA